MEQTHRERPLPCVYSKYPLQDRAALGERRIKEKQSRIPSLQISLARQDPVLSPTSSPCYLVLPAQRILESGRGRKKRKVTWVNNQRTAMPHLPKKTQTGVEWVDGETGSLRVSLRH